MIANVWWIPLWSGVSRKLGVKEQLISIDKGFGIPLSASPTTYPDGKMPEICSLKGIASE